MRTRTVWPFVGVSAVCVVVAATGTWLGVTRPELSLRPANTAEAGLASPPPCETFGSDVLAAQQAPEYLEAKRLYAAKDYRGALATVNRLLESRSWSEQATSTQRSLEKVASVQPGAGNRCIITSKGSFV